MLFQIITDLFWLACLIVGIPILSLVVSCLIISSAADDYRARREFNAWLSERPKRRK